MSHYTISVLSFDESQNDSDGITSKGYFASEEAGGAIRRLVQHELDTEKLKTNLSSFVTGMTDVFEQISSSISDYSLDEIEITADVSVTGGVSLIGSAEVGMTGGITLKFKRNSCDE